MFVFNGLTSDLPNFDQNLNFLNQTKDRLSHLENSDDQVKGDIAQNEINDGVTDLPIVLRFHVACKQHHQIGQQQQGCFIQHLLQLFTSTAFRLVVEHENTVRKSDPQNAK